MAAQTSDSISQFDRGNFLKSGCGAMLRSCNELRDIVCRVVTARQDLDELLFDIALVRLESNCLFSLHFH